MSKVSRIVWISSTLNEVGGGTRLLLEGVKYYRSQGVETNVITWAYDEEALFDGHYPDTGIHEIKSSSNVRGTLTARAIDRLRTIGQLRRLIRNFDPDIVLAQSEYDVTLLRIAMLGTGYRYASFVFGQMFQFHKDLAKYAWPFRRHLNQIRQSTPGYRMFVPDKRPRSRFRDILLAQAIAIPRYLALRGSKAIFVFSKQVQWEVSKLYGAPSIVLKGAYSRDRLGNPVEDYDRSKLNDRPGERILLSLCRLIEKKRVALKIDAFAVLVNERGQKDLRLVIGGKGEEMDNLVAQVERLGLTDHVTFLGYVPENEVFPLTAICDVYLSLDVADFDISPFEALALRRKVVWSSEMDLDDYLEKCGAVFPVEPSPTDVADAIERALARDDATIDWSCLDRYSWESYFASILQAIEASD